MKLKIERMEARDLVDRGSIIDIQDPALIIQVGGEEQQTRRIKHAGINANFDETFLFDLNDKDYAAGKIEIAVEAVHKGAAGNRNLHIGKGKIPLKSAVPSTGSAITFTIELTHQPPMFASFKKGTINMTGTIIDSNAEKDAVAAAVEECDENAKALEKLTDETTNEFLRSQFGEIGELYEDVYCALSGRFLHTGRMYITSHFICFYSKLFGREKKLRIPYEHVAKIELEQDLVLVLHKNVIIKTGTRDYKFWSFWDADQAYNMINGHYEHYHKDHQQRKSSITVGAVDETDDESVVETVGDDDGVEALNRSAEQVKHKISVISDESLPVSVAEYAQLFIEDGAKYNYKSYHESVGDSQVELANWNQEISKLSSGTDRELKFFKPVNLPGLASTRGVKLQRYCRFEDNGLTLSSSTRLESVPAADCFSVEDSVVVRKTGEQSVSVEITFEVAFNKSTWMKSMIESPTNREMQKWLADYFAHAQKVCKTFRDVGGVLETEDGDEGADMDDDEIDAILGKFKARGYQYGSEEFANVKLSRNVKVFDHKVPKASERPRDASAHSGIGWFSLSLFPTKKATTTATSTTASTAPVKRGAVADRGAPAVATPAAAATGESSSSGTLLPLLQVVTLLVLIYVLFSISWKISAIESHMRTIAAAAANTSSGRSENGGDLVMDLTERLSNSLIVGMTGVAEGLSKQQMSAIESITAALQEQHESSQTALLKFFKTIADSK